MNGGSMTSITEVQNNNHIEYQNTRWWKKEPNSYFVDLNQFCLACLATMKE